MASLLYFNINTASTWCTIMQITSTMHEMQHTAIAAKLQISSQCNASWANDYLYKPTWMPYAIQTLIDITTTYSTCIHFISKTNFSVVYWIQPKESLCPSPTHTYIVQYIIRAKYTQRLKVYMHNDPFVLHNNIPYTMDVGYVKCFTLVCDSTATCSWRVFKSCICTSTQGA